MDCIRGIGLGLRTKWPSIVHNFVAVPVGIVLMLCMLYGINAAIEPTGITLPASVVCMLALFFGLLVLEKIAGTKRASKAVKIVGVPADFTLRWMNVLFTPSFTLLPLASPVSVAEAFEIAAVFVGGYVVTFVGVAYTVRGLQLISTVKRRPYSSNNPAEDNIELTPIAYRREGLNSSRSLNTVSVKEEEHTTPAPLLTTPPQAASTRSTTNSVELNEDVRSCVRSRPQQQIENTTSTLSLRASAFVVRYFDWGVLVALFITGIAIYFTVNYAMPLHLGIVLIIFRFCMLMPAKIRLWLHPIIVCGSSSILVIYIFCLMHRENFIATLRLFKTGRNYTKLFDSSLPYPGAGDVLASVLDVSIVALAIPMYNYRTDLRRHMKELLIPSILVGVISFFAYPPLAHAVGVAPTRALAFVARSATLALAGPITQALGGSMAMIPVVAILSGVLGVIVGPTFLRLLRIRQDDYLTRGITLGINSSAVASANLLNTDPRAAAMSSLSFFLFGIVLVILSAIPAVANVIRSWVSLPPL